MTTLPSWCWLLTVSLILLILGCGARSSRSPGDGGAGQATFTCEPQPVSSRGCSMLTAFGVTAGEPGVKYPVGCTVIFPVKHPFYPADWASCSCEESPSGGDPVWGCAL